MADMRTIPQLLDSLTVLRHIREAPPVLCLRDLCASIAAGNAREAENDYCAMTNCLASPYRRVTGDMWKDFLFSSLIETPNRFSEAFAAGKPDPALYGPVRKDLRALKSLFDVTSEKITSRITDLRPPQTELKSAKYARAEKDSAINSMATAAWYGRPTPAAKPRFVAEELEIRPDATLPPWKYDQPVEHKPPYASDAKLAILYRRFLTEEDWADLAEPLGEFHAECGTGAFLRYKRFAAGAAGFTGADGPWYPQWDGLFGIDAQKRALLENVDSFMHGQTFENALLFGPGTGKSSAICAICEQYPDLRLIVMNEQDPEKCAALIDSLSRQPLHFAVLFDDLSLRDFEYRRLKAVLSRCAYPNVMLVATSTATFCDDALFPIELSFPALDREQFMRAAGELARHMGADAEETMEACEAYADSGGVLSVRTAARIVKRVL